MTPPLAYIRGKIYKLLNGFAGRRPPPLLSISERASPFPRRSFSPPMYLSDALLICPCARPKLHAHTRTHIRVLSHIARYMRARKAKSFHCAHKKSNGRLAKRAKWSRGHTYSRAYGYIRGRSFDESSNQKFSTSWIASSWLPALSPLCRRYSLAFSLSLYCRRASYILLDFIRIQIVSLRGRAHNCASCRATAATPFPRTHIYIYIYIPIDPSRAPKRKAAEKQKQRGRTTIYSSYIDVHIYGLGGLRQSHTSAAA